MSVSAVALFCEDIRDETSGSTTLVGILPDNVKVPAVPGSLPKLAIYIRIHIDVCDEPRSIQVFLEFLDGTEHKIGDFPKEMVENARLEAIAADNLLVGLIANVITGPFPVPTQGRVVVKLKFDEQSQIIGGLNFAVDR